MGPLGPMKPATDARHARGHKRTHAPRADRAYCGPIPGLSALHLNTSTDRPGSVRLSECS